jgi:hypothetical protein
MITIQLPGMSYSMCRRRVVAKHLFLLALSSILTVGSLASSTAFAASDDETIKNALSAAPEAVAKDAAVMDWNMKTLREGTNGFTCMPDDTNTPSNDPMCLDKNAMAWLHALMNKKDPPPGVGFGYMLQGGTAASNVDPYATQPSGGKWIEDGPHVMIFNIGDQAASYPQPKENSEVDVSKPYVMYPGTPYAHLMVPVK